MTCYLPWILLVPSWGDRLCLIAHGDPLPPFTAPFDLYLKAFALTLSVEAAFMIALWRRTDRRFLLAIVAANLLTHPFAVYVWLPLSSRLNIPSRETLLAAELLIPFIEAAVYAAFRVGSKWKCVATSLIANLASWSLIALMQVWGWF